MIQNTQFRAASLIVQLGNAVTYYRNLKMEHIGLTSVQSDALIAALRNPGITAARLKEQLQLSQSTAGGQGPDREKGRSGGCAESHPDAHGPGAGPGDASERDRPGDPAVPGGGDE